MGGVFFETMPVDVDLIATARSQKKSLKDQLGNIVKRIDAYEIESRSGSVTGGIVTLVSITFTVWFTVTLFIQLMKAPLRVSNEIIWSEYTAPYPIQLKCVASSGCLISNTVKDTLAFTSCLDLGFGEIVDLDIGYFHNPLHGISALAQDTGDQFSGIVAVKSETLMPAMKESDDEGVLDIFHDIYPGTTLLSMVYTQNKTMSEKNSRRREYFGLASDSSSTLWPGSTTCTGAWTSSAQARLRLQQSAYMIKVTSSFSLPSWAGASFGTFAGVLSIGGYILSTIEAQTVKKLAETMIQRTKSTKILASPNP